MTRRWASTKTGGSFDRLTEAQGDCYEVALRLLLGLGRPSPVSPNAVLVHGQPTLQRPPYEKFGHAWVEDGDTVYDYSNDREITMDRGLYYALGHVERAENLVYSQRSARQHAVMFEHFGPWEGPFAGKPKRKNPKAEPPTKGSPPTMLDKLAQDVRAKNVPPAQEAKEKTLFTAKGKKRRPVSDRDLAALEPEVES